MRVLGFWNNKGGTGKTSLCFQAICAFAATRPGERVLVADVCPQANLSELLLGGQENDGGRRLLALHGESGRRSIGGYFQNRLPRPYDSSSISPLSFICNPGEMNSSIPQNIRLVAGDPLLELQANAVADTGQRRHPGHGRMGRHRFVVARPPRCVRRRLRLLLRRYESELLDVHADRACDV